MERGVGCSIPSPSHVLVVKKTDTIKGVKSKMSTFVDLIRFENCSLLLLSCVASILKTRHLAILCSTLVI